MTEKQAMKFCGYAFLALVIICALGLTGSLHGATFGKTDIGAEEAIINYAQGNCGASYVYTASAGDTITTYHIYGWSGSGTGTLDLIVYDITSGVNNATRLTTPVTVTLTQSTGGNAQWEVSSAVTHGLTAGKDYMVACGNETGDVRIRYTSEASGQGTYQNGETSLTATWTHTNDTWVMSMYVTYTTSGGVVKRFGVLK